MFSRNFKITICLCGIYLNCIRFGLKIWGLVSNSGLIIIIYKGPLWSRQDQGKQVHFSQVHYRGVSGHWLAPQVSYSIADLQILDQGCLFPMASAALVQCVAVPDAFDSEILILRKPFGCFARHCSLHWHQ